MWTRLFLTPITLFLLAWSTCVSGAVIYVDVDATGSNNGSSWNNAFNSLQDGLANAMAGDEIRVAAGTYTPDTGAGYTPGDRYASFTLRDQVIVKGGYAGVGEPKPNAYHPDLYPTILSGDLFKNDPPLDLSRLSVNEKWLNDPNRLDNSYSVVMADHVDANAVLDSVTIVQGQSEGIGSNEYSRGAGLYISFANPTIRNCIFRDHVGTYGGGIFIKGWSSFKDPPLIENCEFANNFSSHYGPALTLWNEAIVRDCNFHDNCNDLECGAVYIYKSGGLIEGCTFTQNHGDRKGGAIYQVGNGPEITHCVFTENAVWRDGGAIYCKDNDDSLSITHCLFFKNHADDNGGAVYLKDVAEFNFSYSRFVANEAYDYGGAISLENSRGVFLNCLFNTNPGTGMVHCDQSGLVFTNCTLTDLTEEAIAIMVTASDSSLASQSQISLQNCISWNGLKDIGYGANTDLSDYQTRYSITTLPTRFNPATGNGDPIFVDPLGDDGIPGTLDDDLHVYAPSLAIDSGDNTYVPAEILTDLGGRDRFIDDPMTRDIGNGTAPIVDRGVYEYTLGGDYPPVADAGNSRIEWAWIDGIATIQLDGSGSYDEDKDPLTYLWTWPGGSATGVNPTIQLTQGIYTIILDVNDGLNTASDSVEIEVLGAWEALLTTSHELLVRDDFRTEDFTVQAYISEIAGDEVDLLSPLTISTLEGQTVSIPAFDTHIQEETLIGDKLRTTVTGAFDKDSVLAQIAANGGVTMTVTGTLLTDQVFEGTAYFNIQGPLITDLDKPTPNPAEWAPVEPNLVELPSEPNDPNRIHELTGEPYALQRNPRANNGAGEWYILMRATSATDPDGGTILYEFDCFEDDRLDRAPMAGPEGRYYEAGPIAQDDLKRYTFRCRAIGSNGSVTDWSYWRWVYQVYDGVDAFNILPEDGWPGVDPPEADPNAPQPNPIQWAVEEPNLVTDPNDPNQTPFLLPGTPQGIFLDPRVENGWAIAMRAAEAVSPDEGTVEYQFDCFENNLYDRDWSTDRFYTVLGLLEQDLTQYTFRVRARNANGNVGLWSPWEWIKTE